jgi:hypothetical protein
MTFEEQAKISGYIDLINESVHTSDDIDIGDIDAVSRDFIVVKRGFVNVHYYYIPISKVEGWDGNVLWLKITEDETKSNYERNIVPGPYRYYIKDYPFYNAAYYPTLAIIPPRYVKPLYSTTANIEAAKILQCDLCNKHFNTPDELSNHVSNEHG